MWHQRGNFVEIRMSRTTYRMTKWAALIASGTVLGLISPTCDPLFQFIQTVLLAFVAGTTFYLARNV